MKQVHCRHYRFPDGRIILRKGKFAPAYSPKGGATVVVLEDYDGSCYAGVSVCSHKDSYVKKVGRELARQRAEAARRQGKRVIVPKRYDRFGEQVLLATPVKVLSKVLVDGMAIS